MQESQSVARRMRSRSVHPEHLLLALINQNNDFTIDVMKRLSVNQSSINASLTDFISNVINKAESNIVIQTKENEAPQLDSKSANLLRIADLEARMGHDNSVDVKHLILAFLHDGINTSAKDILHSNNMNYDDVLKIANDYKADSTEPPIHHDNITDGINIDDDDDDDMLDDPDGSKAKAAESQTMKAKAKTGRKTPIIDNFTTDLTKAAEDKKLDPVVGRENEIHRLSEILCRRKKNNPILIGEPGVGKSSIVEGLAQLIADNKISPILHNKRLVALDLAAMVAGTKYRGQFEERIKGLINELEDNPNIIVFIDEIHTIIGAGSAAGTMDAANMLKPALARGVVQCIGATTLDEYRKTIEKDGALERRFQKIIVNPTTPEETLQILHNIKTRYENHHHVRYTEEAIKACVSLTQRYVTDRAFPDKAIDALDEVGARTHLSFADIPQSITDKEAEINQVTEQKRQAVRNQDFEKAALYRDKQAQLEKQLAEMTREWENGMTDCSQEISEFDVADVVSMMTGVPVQKVTESEGDRLKSMSETLKKAVIAQDNAIDKIVKAIRRNRIGLRDPNHPIGVFMFLGPTGVGKTYLTKKLAEHMFGSADALIRIDMSEYTESFNSSRLVGAPPGYVGYDEGGQLTERVRRKPYSIVLLDEIEKAHGNIFNMLLQVMDEGRMTDGNGRHIDFRNTIIIMTSNTGTRQLKEFAHGVGFNAGNGTGAAQSEKDKEYARNIIQKSLSKQFAPEFLNRLDEIITFDQLDKTAIREITDIELKGLYQRVEELGYKLEITDEAKDFVADKGYDVQFGARPLKRAIQTHIEDYLCERLLDEHLTQGATITIGIDDIKK